MEYFRVCFCFHRWCQWLVSESWNIIIRGRVYRISFCDLRVFLFISFSITTRLIYCLGTTSLIILIGVTRRDLVRWRQSFVSIRGISSWFVWVSRWAPMLIFGWFCNMISSLHILGVQSSVHKVLHVSRHISKDSGSLRWREGCHHIFAACGTGLKWDLLPRLLIFHRSPCC